tara:strand:- start:401 stop:580 length:180 start_codon:yes stop_codon:yes gene_type:complete
MTENKTNIVWIGTYVDDDETQYNQWYCNKCNEDIDDKIQLMEMHECKKIKVNTKEREKQ